MKGLCYPTRCNVRGGLLYFSLWVVAMAIAARPAGAELVFATSADLSASSARTVTSYHNGIRLAFAEINAAGGYRGENLTYIDLDDAYNVTRAVANVKRLLTSYNLTAILGPSGSYVYADSVTACLPYARNASVPMLSPITGAIAFRSPYEKFVVNIMAAYRDEMFVMVRYAVTALMHKRISIIYENSGFGRPPAQAAMAMLAQLGVTAHTVGVYTQNSYDVTAAVESLFAKPFLPQSVIYVGQSGQLGLIVKAYQDRTAYPTKFIGVSVAYIPEIRDRAGPNVNYSNVLLTRFTPDPLDNSFTLSHILGYLTGYFVRQVLTRHDSSQPVTPASFLDIVYSTSVFNVMGLIVGPFVDEPSSAAASCNQGLRQVWLVQLTNTSWVTPKDAGTVAATAPWASCMASVTNLKPSILWGLGIPPSETSPEALDFVAGVRLALDYSNQALGGVHGMSTFLASPDWSGRLLRGVNPYYASNSSAATLDPVSKFFEEFSATGILGLSLASIGNTANGLAPLLASLDGRPVVGVLGGDPALYAQPAQTQLVPHRSSYRLDYFALLDALKLHYNSTRVGLLCVVGTSWRLNAACDEARAAFALLDQVPAFVSRISLPPTASQLLSILNNPDLQDDEALNTPVAAVLYVGQDPTSLETSMRQAARFGHADLVWAVGSYMNTTVSLADFSTHPLLSTSVTPPRAVASDYPELFGAFDAAAAQFLGGATNSSGILQGFIAGSLAVQGLGRMSMPYAGPEFVRQTVFSQQLQVYSLQLGPYLAADGCTADATGACAWCRQGTSSVFVVPSTGLPFASVSSHSYSNCGAPATRLSRATRSECAVRMRYGLSVWADLDRAIRFDSGGAWFYTVAVLLVCASATLSSLAALWHEYRHLWSRRAVKKPSKLKAALLRPNLANRLALFMILSDAVEFSFLFTFSEIPWVSALLDVAFPSWRRVSVMSLNWLGMAAALLWLLLSVAFLHAPTMSVLQRRSPWLISAGSLLLPLIGNVGLVLVVQYLMGAFRIVCTANKCFLFMDCVGLAWTPSHWAAAIVSIILLLAYVPMVTMCSQVWQRLQDGLDLQVKAWMNVLSNFVRVVFALVPVIFTRLTLAAAVANLALNAALVVIVLLANPTRYSWYPILKVTGLLISCSTAAVMLSTFVLRTADPLPPVLALIVSWFACTALGLAIFRRRHARIFQPAPQAPYSRAARFAKVFRARFQTSKSNSLGSQGSDEIGNATAVATAKRMHVRWIVELEQAGKLSRPEATWLLLDAERGGLGLLSHLGVGEGATRDAFETAVFTEPVLAVVRRQLAAVDAKPAIAVAPDGGGSSSEPAPSTTLSDSPASSSRHVGAILATGNGTSSRRGSAASMGGELLPPPTTSRRGSAATMGGGGGGLLPPTTSRRGSLLVPSELVAITELAAAAQITASLSRSLRSIPLVSTPIDEAPEQAAGVG
ncbi:hypothetical protein H9P43_003666 [Blastocladiella emersonii ATCC 22665]|nr:hypothetical protein H9P43_003666 [Blastocladiella emersonii ATCC 22665]